MKSDSGYLGKSGLKKTKQRTAVLEILEDSDQPLSAEEIFIRLCKKEKPGCLSTVYRSLEQMSEKNVVTKLSIDGEKSLYEINCMLHRHYLTCLDCGKILAIKTCPIGSYEKTLEKQTGFTIINHKLNVYGYCPECKANH